MTQLPLATAHAKICREEEAAARLVEPAFLRRVRAALGTSNAIVPNRARGTSAGSKRAKPTDQWSCHDGVMLDTHKTVSYLRRLHYLHLATCWEVMSFCVCPLTDTGACESTCHTGFIQHSHCQQLL